MSMPSERELEALVALNRAQRIFDDAFAKAREPRSAEYKQGVFCCLRFHAMKAAGLPARRVLDAVAYRAGTASLDAYLAGVDEGHALWRAAQATEAA